MAELRLPEPSFTGVKDLIGFIPKLVNYFSELIRVLRFNFQDLSRRTAKNTGIFTLTDSVTSTTINDNFVKEDSVILPIPATADAALDWASGSFYVEVTVGSFTVYHDSDASTDRVFKYLVF